MSSNYLATQKDLKTIEDGLKFVLHPKMSFVFKDKSRIINTIVVSYDSKFIYIWMVNPVKLMSKIPHNLGIPDKWQMGWWADIVSKQIKKYLSEEIRKTTRFEIPVISGGLITPFITLQEAKNVSRNPYVTRESYFATIIHEFGHVYWNSYRLWWFSKKDENTRYLKIAQKLYDKKGPKGRKTRLEFPLPSALGEIFAFCTEYASSKIFWPNHKNNLDKFGKQRIDQLIGTEKTANLDKESSVIEPTKNPHDFSSVFGKIILEKYPTTWPAILTQNFQGFL